MAKPIKTWTGTEWVDVAVLAPSTAGFATTSSIAALAPLNSPIFTGTVILPTSASGGASIRIPHGTAPSAPTNGDIWTTTTGLFAQINGTTQQYAHLSGATFTGNVTVNGVLDASELRETVVDVTLSTNTATLDWTAGNVYYIATAPTGAMTFNVTNLPTDNSKIMTVGVIVTQGATGRIPSTFQIDGVSQTIKWVGGSAPTPTSGAGKIDIFTFTIQRTSAGAWIVYGTSSLGF